MPRDSNALWNPVISIARFFWLSCACCRCHVELLPMRSATIPSEQTNLLELLLVRSFYKMVGKVTIAKTVVLWKLNGVSTSAIKHERRSRFFLAVSVPSLSCFLFSGERLNRPIYGVFWNKVISSPRLKVASRLACLYFDLLFLTRDERFLLIVIACSCTHRGNHRFLKRLIWLVIGHEL